MATIRGKITVTYTLLFIVIFAVLGIYLSSFFGNQYMTNLERDLINNTKLLSSFIVDLDEKYLYNYAEDVSLTLGLRVTIIDMEGRPLAETSRPYNELDNHFNRPEIQSALRGEITTSLRYSDTFLGEMVYAAAPIYGDGDEIIGFLRLSKSVNEIKVIINNIRTVIFIASFMGILSTWIFGRIIAGAFTTNIDKLIAKAKDIGKGHFALYKSIETKDEISELETVFNDMGTNISIMMNNVSKERARLENILKNLPIGVLLINKKGIVEASNSAAREMLGSDIHGVSKPLINLTRDYHVNDFVRNLLKGEEQQTEVIITKSSGEKCFVRLKGAGLYNNQGGSPEEIVVVLQDISDLRRLEQMRKDLVANVSHELRTPVTAIQGFAETLLDGDVDKETTEHFLKIIKEESIRLSRLITDLLNLSTLENDEKIRKDGISNLKEIAYFVEKLLEDKIKSKNHKFIVDLPKEIILAVRQDYVEQVLVNYIDNAIKYTPPETTITLTADKQDNGFARIVVIDDGPGIPEMDQGRLFERFFKVEKSRQRNVGGTGLGLAIVKHIVEGFNGEVGLRSSKEGTAFWATLPYK